ncbi:hypothetical protein VPH35_042978 [Triticum aestivum]|nr:RING finger and transmembrane domain-containing protein 2-like [Triticum aestivum]
MMMINQLSQPKRPDRSDAEADGVSPSRRGHVTLASPKHNPPAPTPTPEPEPEGGRRIGKAGRRGVRGRGNIPKPKASLQERTPRAATATTDQPDAATATASPLRRLRLRLAACLRAPPPCDAAADPPALLRRRRPWKLPSRPGPAADGPMMDAPPPPRTTTPTTTPPVSPRPQTQPQAQASAAVSSRRYGVHFSASSFIQAPLSALLEYSGVLRADPGPHHPSAGGGEVSIRIVGPAATDGAVVQEEGDAAGGAQPSAPAAAAGADSSSSYQRYDIQQVARWVEQILPFTLLLLVVFIRQHLQGFFVTIWIAAVMFKSNDILRKQTALKGERKMLILVGITILFVVHVSGVYWCYKNGDLIRPLVMLPPKDIPPFWHAIFVILVNDTMVRQTAMIVKCILLMYYRNTKGRSYRRQGQMLTLVEYFLLLYRALLPAPVWYRFFLNKEYGSLFSSLTTGLYLTFKLTSVVEKIQSFFTSLRALSHKDFHYGSYATSEQVAAAGDMCAICQEKMHVPILLRCKHVFCEDCVSEWFERERTCPLCRALVKPADLRSFGDGSTSLFFQLF